MVVNLASLAVNVHVQGVGRAVAAIGRIADMSTRLQRSLRGTTDGVVKTWLAFQLLTSQTSITGAYIGLLGKEIGWLIDTVLKPFTPVLDAIANGLWAFSEWVDGQSPLVKAGLLAVGLAGAMMWLGVSGPAALAIAGLVSFGLWATTQGPIVQAMFFAIAAAAGIMWLATLAPVAAVLAALGLPVVALAALGAALAGLTFLAVKYWDDIKAAFSSAIEAIMGWLQPLIDAVRTVGEGLGGIVGSIGGGISSGISAVGDFVGLGGGVQASIPSSGGGGGGGSVSTDNSIGGIVVNTVGGAGSGYDSALAMQQQAYLARRTS